MSEDSGAPIAALSAFVDVLLSDCIVIRCDDGLYICQKRAQGDDSRIAENENSFAFGRGEIAAHIRAMTDQASDCSENEDDPANASATEGRNSDDDESSTSGGNSTSSDGEYDSRHAQVVVNVGRCKRRRHRK